MKHLALCAALLLCGNAQAATYVYKANAYQGHEGRCGGGLLPFKMTITVRPTFPPNSNLNVPIEAISLNAGEGFGWKVHNTKKHQLGGIFVTDAQANIAQWSVAGGYHRSDAWTINEDGTVEDMVEFRCGSAGG